MYTIKNHTCQQYQITVLVIFVYQLLWLKTTSLFHVTTFTKMTWCLATRWYVSCLIIRDCRDSVLNQRDLISEMRQSAGGRAFSCKCERSHVYKYLALYVQVSFFLFKNITHFYKIVFTKLVIFQLNLQFQIVYL